jgi:hypothetical protein
MLLSITNKSNKKWLAAIGLLRNATACAYYNTIAKAVLSIAGLMLSASLCYKHSFSLPDTPEIWYVLREQASNSLS